MLALFLAVTASAQTAGNNPAQVLEVRKIWDAGAHNAFTDLIRWKNVWWCTFREAEHHVGEGGKIRVLTSTDGQEWASAALVSEADVDLRDPKFSITPDGRLMIVCGGTIYVGQGYRGRQSRVLFSNDGRIWTVPVKVLTSGDWLARPMAPRTIRIITAFPPARTWSAAWVSGRSSFFAATMGLSGT